MFLSKLNEFILVKDDDYFPDDGYLIPRPGPAQQRLLYDPALLEELYERGLLEDQPGNHNISIWLTLSSNLVITTVM